MGIERVATLGEDNEQVLSQLANYSTQGITELYKDGIIANTPDAEDLQI